MLVNLSKVIEAGFFIRYVVNNSFVIGSKVGRQNYQFYNYFPIVTYTLLLYDLWDGLLSSRQGRL